MILSASRRTDIPAFYSEWFYGRLRDGFVYTRNPMNTRQVSRIKITPDVVDCIVFWTKNPAPMLDRLEELSDYDYYFQFTLNSYGNEVEPNVPSLSERLDTFAALSDKIGRERVIWRYDPILFTDRYSPEYHLESFGRTAERLAGRTEKAVISIVDTYPTKNKAKLLKLGAKSLSENELESFMEKMALTAKKHGLAIAACAENIPFEKHGIEHNSCIDRELIERITGSALKVGRDGQRPFCGCVKCDDIGSYDTCPHGCLYCYANYREAAVAERLKAFRTDSPILCDFINEETDKITERPVRSYKQNGGEEIQLTLY